MKQQMPRRIQHAKNGFGSLVLYLVPFYLLPIIDEAQGIGTPRQPGIFVVVLLLLLLFPIRHHSYQNFMLQNIIVVFCIF